MSSITQMELIVGAFNKREVSMIKKAFSDFTIVEINTSVSSFKFIPELTVMPKVNKKS